MLSFKHYLLTELFQSMPAINTRSQWSVLDIDDYDPTGGIQAKEVTYNTEIPLKDGKPVIYEFVASIGIQKPGKEISADERKMLSNIHINHLPAAEITFKTLNHPTHGDSIGMVGDANAILVMNYALAFTRDVITAYKLRLVSFSASSKKDASADAKQDSRELHSNSRAKVYERLVQRFAGQIGFSYSKYPAPHNGNLANSTDFILIRK